jgi:hypothetical protein
MPELVTEQWRGIMASNGLAGFDALWALQADWFEPPNRRRGGWSGVSRYRLRRPDGSSVGVFVKRQEDHGYRTLLHPLRGLPTFVRELANIQRYRRCGVPTLEPVYCAWRLHQGRQQAILVTEELAGYRSLLEIERDWQQQGWPPRAERLPVLYAVADLVRRMHACRLQHNCLYPKHVFLRRGQAGWQARVIDLEKTKRPWCRRLAQVRDLSTLSRYSAGWSRSERLRFFLRYLGQPRLTLPAKRLARKVLRDIRGKSKPS